MKIQIKLLGGYLVISLIFIILGVFLIAIVSSINPIVIELDKDVRETGKSIKLTNLISEMEFLRLELRQATTNFIVTQDEFHQQRYNIIEKKIDDVIREAIEKSDNRIDQKIFEGLNENNENLEQTEKQIFTLVQENKIEEAKALLVQEVYANLNDEFSHFLEIYFNRKRTESEDVFSKLVQVSLSVQANKEKLNALARIVLFSIFVTVIIAILLGFFISRSISKPITKLRDTAKQIGKGNLDVKVDIKSKDEIGELSQTFDEMRLGLKDRNELLNSLLKTFKGKFGNVATVLVINSIRELLEKNPRIIKILPKSLTDSIKKERELKERLK